MLNFNVNCMDLPCRGKTERGGFMRTLLACLFCSFLVMVSGCGSAAKKEVSSVAPIDPSKCEVKGEGNAIVRFVEKYGGGRDKFARFDIAYVMHVSGGLVEKVLVSKGQNIPRDALGIIEVVTCRHSVSTTKKKMFFPDEWSDGE